MRRIVQIAACAAGCYEPGAGTNYTSELFALCDDGSLWVLDGMWVQCKPIPQPKTESQIAAEEERAAELAQAVAQIADQPVVSSVHPDVPY